ncbi:uncharacterized protein EDB93DRAFT_1106508 [Suillus bovinus]|uniref:uncharacterized protein n=1 Tax=Suillus bovinus TaxID=48563 RepID=UPI001B86C878|nr:uncharacterized protein EDB93DRAFT_1106508 [Suillus bovinus]KAG2137886.1 hypothetical protein EDB93DRAFT_1106508 [Suillus bovinus]
MLVIIHIVLIIFSVHRWEHRVTFSFTPTNNDFWPVVLSASLQAFYTVYTAVLLFLTQRLAISRILVRQVKLTAIHDVSGAWAGLGSALSSVWRQTDIPAAWWTTSAVAAYLVSITVLDVTSSTLLQFQTFNTSTTTSASTTLGWPNNFGNNLTTDLTTITSSLPVVNQLTGLAFPGLSNTTLYDTLKANDITGIATVNATTVTSCCGLVPNVTHYANSSEVTFPLGPNMPFWLNSSAIGQNQIHIIPSIVNIGDRNSWLNGLCFMVSTLLEIDPSVQYEVTIDTVPYYPYPFEVEGFSNSDIVNQTYFIQCSLSVNTTDGMVDTQTNNLLSPTPIPQSSTQWEIYQFEWSTTAWQANIFNALATPDNSSHFLFEPIIDPTFGDEYIMSLVGLNLTEEYMQYINDGPASISNFTLRPDELELAVARAAAQLIWLAGQMGTGNGGIDPGNGMAYVNEVFIALHFNINLLPLAFAASASMIMLGLALHITRAFDGSHDTQAAIPDIGVLQLLWLGHRSASINEALEDVRHPTEANLRRAGMIDVRLTKTISDEEDSGSSTANDILSYDADHYHDRDDVM